MMVRTLSIFRPGRSYPSVSATGADCALMCDHCRGHYLEAMHDVSREGELLRFASMLWKRGGKGFLLSGGCDADGRIPFPPHILEQVRGIKASTGLVINAHTGLVGGEEARALAEAGIDCFSFDVVADRSILKDIMHLDATSSDVRSSLRSLVSTGKRVVPHVLAGLKGVIGEAEREAVSIAAEMEPDMAVLILHIPTKGTPLEGVDGTPSRQVISLAGSMREGMPRSELVLGCMRPRGDPCLEVEVLRCGFDGIVQPSSRTMEWIGSEGYIVREVEGCCAAFPANNNA